MTALNKGDFGIDKTAAGENPDPNDIKIAGDWTKLLEETFSKDQGFLSGLSSLYDKNVVVKKGKLDETLKEVTKDASSPEALAKYQAALAEYTLYRNAQSNAVKAYKDVDANTIRNFN